MRPELLQTVSDAHRYVRARRLADQSIGLVPTMGALHEGHLSLIRLARMRAQRVIVTIFVNPLQFGPTEDLDKYPRQLEQDRRLAGDAGADVVFAPTRDEMYPTDEQTRVRVERLTLPLCGASRPVHFEGVTTVVCKLFAIFGPDVAIFGEKDFQQLCVIRRMAKDIGFPVEVVGGPIIREADGLALSSRNAYLSVDE
ncbi:MAG: pantoate--beta-alanine ligase, partial [Myxococcales bacterium]|nr:pantoate--beta-alanine ligase [Myxococcales bacterium]